MKSTNVKKNFLYQFLYQILISILPFITSPYIARVLGADKIGNYSYVYSIITIFLLFANLGIANYGNRLIAKNRAEKSRLNIEFTSLFYLHFILSIIILLIYFIYIKLFCVENAVIFYIQAIFIIANMLDISWLFFGLEKFKLTVTRNTIIKLITVVCIFIFVKNKNDLWIYTVIMAFGTLLNQLSLWGFAFRYINFVKVGKKEILKHIKPMLVLFVAAIAVAIFSYTDKIMLGQFSSMSQLGYYENAFKMIEFPVGFITALGTVMLPKMSNMVVSNKTEEIKKYINNSMKFSMILASAICFGLLSIGKEFSILFWGEEFVTSGVIIQYLSICIVFMSWNGVIRTQYLIPNEKDKSYVIAVAVSAIVNIIINYILIPRIGAVGAAIGTIISYMIIFIIQNIAVCKKIPIFKYLINSIMYFVLGFLMYCIILLLNNYLTNSIISLVTKIFVGGGMYVILLIVYSFIIRDDFIIGNIKRIIKIGGKNE